MSFGQSILGAANAIYGDPEEALVAAAQAILETGGGKHVPGGNLFGIKGGGGPQLATTEVVNGVPVKTTASFEQHGSPADSISKRMDFLQRNPRYKRAGYFDAQTAEEKALALQRAGYATDPQYATKLMNIIGKLRGGPNPVDVRMASLDPMNTPTGDPRTGMMDTPYSGMIQTEPSMNPYPTIPGPAPLPEMPATPQAPAGGLFGTIMNRNPRTGLAPIQMMGLSLMAGSTPQEAMGAMVRSVQANALERPSPRDQYNMQIERWKLNENVRREKHKQQMDLIKEGNKATKKAGNLRAALDLAKKLGWSEAGIGALHAGESFNISRQVEEDAQEAKERQAYIDAIEDPEEKKQAQADWIAHRKKWIKESEIPPRSVQNTTRKMYNSSVEVKTYKEARVAAERFLGKIMAEVNSGGIKDYTTLIDYIKSIEPESVVKETEAEMLIDFKGIIPGLEAQWSKMRGEGIFTTNDIKDMASIIYGGLKGLYGGAKAQEANFRKLAKEDRLPEDRYIGVGLDLPSFGDWFLKDFEERMGGDYKSRVDWDKQPGTSLSKDDEEAVLDDIFGVSKTSGGF